MLPVRETKIAKGYYFCLNNILAALSIMVTME
jgi:hypothetical protein